MTAGSLDIRRVSKRFGAFAAVDDLSLDIAAGEFFALLGPSGCGKSTLLRMIAGFETPDGGEIRLDGAPLSALPPHLRPVNMMFQSYALFPHMSVARNVAFGLRQERLARSIVTARVEQMLALVQLQGLADRKPHQLSGGQRQRVALARALAKQPKVLLLDEPLAALDKKLRQDTQDQLRALHRKLGTTFVIVTHDQEEAMTLAGRIAVMERGKIAQVGTPAEIYEQPASRYVAGFIGDINLIEGTVARADPLGSQVDCAGIGYFRIEHPNRKPLGTRVTLAIRPEKLRVSHEGPTGKSLNVLQGTLREVSYLGETSHYRVDVKGATLTASLPNQGAAGRLRAGIGDPVWLSFALDGASVLET